MYQTGGTIETLLNKVEQHEYILPAIQRECKRAVRTVLTK